jgi:hypothetical protein
MVAGHEGREHQGGVTIGPLGQYYTRFCECSLPATGQGQGRLYWLCQPNVGFSSES